MGRSALDLLWGSMTPRRKKQLSGVDKVHGRGRGMYYLHASEYLLVPLTKLCPSTCLTWIEEGASLIVRHIPNQTRASDIKAGGSRLTVQYFSPRLRSPCQTPLRPSRHGLKTRLCENTSEVATASRLNSDSHTPFSTTAVTM